MCVEFVVACLFDGGFLVWVFVLFLVCLFFYQRATLTFYKHIPVGNRNSAGNQTNQVFTWQGRKEHAVFAERQAVTRNPNHEQQLP